uniref:GST N-terminal domain-containing protein n=2 Tax=Pseudo-nitzschia australis TaxID=44445 RepID=A0A7S4ARC1_9STRA|mmetsp:Transcript_3090/g.6671  ORF Transcript_3090/g.6671 Transcript_3090/m.6671 type:complete len:305 (-) Transcript_3090:191-1105(-)
MITRTICIAAIQAAALYSTANFNLSVESFSLGSSSSATSMEQRTTTTALSMAGGVRTRGLEQRREGATPTEGGMTLYVKAAEDGTSVGDCPFAHYIRMILEEKKLPCQVQPCASNDDKPAWLMEYYEGKLPCLKHKKEAYVESNVIAAYLDYFFPFTDGSDDDERERKAATEKAEDAMEGFFPAVAGYLKDVDGDNDESSPKLVALREKLAALEETLGDNGGATNNLDGTAAFGLLDCRLVPQLYHLKVGIEAFKQHKQPNLETEFPRIHGYLVRSMERSSFQNTSYSPETIEWGWSNARNTIN